MWGRWWWRAGGGFLRQRVSSIGSVTSIGSFSHGYGEKLHPLDPPLLGLRGVVELRGCKGWPWPRVYSEVMARATLSPFS